MNPVELLRLRGKRIVCYQTNNGYRIRKEIAETYGWNRVLSVERMDELEGIFGVKFMKVEYLYECDKSEEAKRLLNESDGEHRHPKGGDSEAPDQSMAQGEGNPLQGSDNAEGSLVSAPITSKDRPRQANGKNVLK